MSIQPNREQAWELLCQYNTTEALRRHALTVEAVMRHFAKQMGEDVDKWGIIGLLHVTVKPQGHSKTEQQVIQ